MSLYGRLIDLGRKPSGLLGRLTGSLMNRGHRDAYVWGLAHLPIEPDSAVLDIGCGGGAAVGLLAAKASEGKVYGIDHSLDMVDLSRKVNKRFIEGGRVQIDYGSVSCLPYSDDMFDTATAFETIEFWPSLSEDLKEVKRVLKPVGSLLVVNRHNAADKEGKWTEFLQIHTSDGYRERLGDAGYVDISIDDCSKEGWIAVVARKPQGKQGRVGTGAAQQYVGADQANRVSNQRWLGSCGQRASEIVAAHPPGGSAPPIGQHKKEEYEKK